MTAALVLMASLAGAQAPSLLYVSQAVPWEPSNAAAAIDWALPSTAAIPLQVTTRVDASPWLVSVPDCDPSPVASLRWCHTMTPDIKSLLDVPGLHRVQVANGLDASASLQLRTPEALPTMCPYTTPQGVSSPKPLGYRMGARRTVNQANPDADIDAFAKRVGELEEWGWRVLWVAVPNSAGQIAQLVMTARCPA